MTPKLSGELEQAVTAHPDGVLKVLGGNGAYWIMTDTAMAIRTEVAKGLAQADRGDIAPWDSNEIKREGRRLRHERSQDS